MYFKISFLYTFPVTLSLLIVQKDVWIIRHYHYLWSVDLGLSFRFLSQSQERKLDTRSFERWTRQSLDKQGAAATASATPPLRDGFRQPEQ